VVFELTTEDLEKRDIYLLATDGSGEVPLVEHPADDWAPFWTPDGKRIVFVSDRMGSPGLWLLDVDDAKPKGAPAMVKEMGKNFYPMGLTPDGSFYYGVGTPAHDVYVATLDFEAGKVLAPPTKMSLRFEGSNYAPVWSPDGKYLAYASRRSSGNVLVIQSVESGQERDLSPKNLHVLQRKAEATPRWSPDGGSILVTGFDSKKKMNSRGRGIYLVDAETGNLTPIVQDESKKEGGKYAPPVWPVFSNDGKQIYYIGGPSIVVHNLETHGERELYRTNTYILRLALSPDGRRLAFLEAARALRPTVVKTISTSGGEPSELYTLKKGKRFSWGVGLSWTPDGAHVVVGAPDAPDQPDELWMIPAEGGEPRKLELGVKVSHLSLHPDGRRIAFTRPEPGGGSEVWVMENFLPTGEGNER
jgi:Tol biopolymer transport system component